MTTTEALRLQLDNARQEIQQLQVENKKLRAEVQRGEEQSAEIEELRQRLLDSEEKVIGAEQEAEQWKEETEKLSTALSGVKGDSLSSPYWILSHMILSNNSTKRV